jgi:hypothetical protein
MVMIMRICVVVFIFCLAIPQQAFSKDYMVELFEEHYREKMIVGGGEMQIYHTWQVKTRYGAKLLVLVGDDHDYREWLRQTRKNHRLFILKIPEAGQQTFVKELAVLVNVQQLHAVTSKKWNCSQCRYGLP